jgi:hypothetical protein
MPNYWIERCAPPRPRSQGIEWDVFISYRSLDRVWAVALYDMLRQCGYTVFLDQFVLVTGMGLASQLAKQLARSASGVLIWSVRSVDSTWVESEMDTMVARKNNSAGSECPFYFVVASLDRQTPPGLQGGQLYMDFSEYPDGPMGTDLVKLTYGLQGKPPSEAAVQQLLAFEQSIKLEPDKLRAMAKANLYDRIEARVTSDEPAYVTSATLSGMAVDLLIRGKKYAAALRTVKHALGRFPSSVRLRQLYGLALRRDGQLDDAAFELNLLVEQGHRDVETLGILASVWADLWEKRTAAGEAVSARDALEQSRNLYAEGFAKVPSDTYTGINAAAKTALLGHLDDARALADRVLTRLQEMEKARGGGPSNDYWERVTEPEALLIKGDWARAADLYHAARVAHQNEAGSIAATGTQVRRLLAVLPVPTEIREKLVAEFGLS